MSNMSYCRFQNTSKDLSDCEQALESFLTDEPNAELSPEELRAAASLIATCVRIAELVAVHEGMEVEELDSVREITEILTDCAGHRRDAGIDA